MSLDLLILAASRFELSGPLSELGVRRPLPGVAHEAREGLGVLLTGVGEPGPDVLSTIVGAKPKHVLQVGFAGGLRAGLAEGDLVVVERVIDSATGEGWDAARFEELRGGLARMRHRMAQGPLLTVPRFLHRAEDKRDAGKTHNAVVCDMESAFVARACAESGIPWSGVRAVSDGADRTVLPGRGERRLRGLLHPKAALGAAYMLHGGRRAQRALTEALPRAVAVLR